MGKIKEDLKLIDYLKEKGISHEDLKTMIEESINLALDEKEGEPNDQEQAEQTEEKSEPEQEEVPTFTKGDIKEMIQEEVRESLKIKRKVPSKGTIIDKKEQSEPAIKDTKRSEAAKEWFEVIV